MLNSDHSKPTTPLQEESVKRRRFQKGSLHLLDDRKDAHSER
jgi:hypothetical protein